MGPRITLIDEKEGVIWLVACTSSNPDPVVPGLQDEKTAEPEHA